MILPVPKICDMSKESCHVPVEITVSAVGEHAGRGVDAFCALFDGAVKVEAGGFVTFEYNSGLEDKPEIYRMELTENRIRVTFRDERGAVNGAASAVLFLRKKNLKQGTVIDYPSCDYRSGMLDLARGLPSLALVENTVKCMALAKYNRLHLHLIDSYGPCYASEVLPRYRFTESGEMCDRAYFDHIRELCERFAIEIIPEIEIPAHADALCEAYPEFKCQVENAQTWTICPGNDDIWPFFRALIGEIVEIFPKSEYIHIGTDELEFRDLKPPRLCHWDECPRCAALRQREQLADRQAEFYYVVDKVYDIVKSFGKKMMMWNDQIDVAHDVPLSRDILIQFWRIASPGRGPYEGCTMEKFLEKGFRVINAYYPYTYIDFEQYLTPEKMAWWTPYQKPEQSPEYADQILGGETCAWELGNTAEYPFYAYTLPSTLALFADKVWGLGEREYGEEYRTALAEFVFGDGSFVTVFDCIGDLIPPRKKGKYTYVPKEELSAPLLQSCMERLAHNPNRDCAATSLNYATLLERILQENS